MQYVNLGRTGLKVSPLCLGTMNFGPHTSEPDAHAIMDFALGEGVNFFDTANVYGGKKYEGETEQIVGRWFAQGGKRREKVVIATKVYNAIGDGPNDRGLSACHIRMACEASLRRLQTDHIDVYQMHHIDRSVPIDEILQAMQQLVHDGKVLYIGGSNLPGWYIMKFNMLAANRNFLGLVSEQPLYSLADRTVELEVLPAALDQGVGVIPWSPLSGGLLGGVLNNQERVRRASEVMKFKIDRNYSKIEKWESFCKELGEEPANLALAWLLMNPAVTAPIIGPRTMDQLKSTLRVPEIKIDAEHMQRIDSIWPGPGGTAPEAYSW